MSIPDIGKMFGAGQVDTFFGLPSCTDRSALSAKAAILGVPHATPYLSVGSYCGNAPAAIRAAIAPFAANIDHVNFDFGESLFNGQPPSVVDCGDLDVDPLQPAANRELIRNAVTEILDAGAVPIVIGGDDSVPIPLFEAFSGHGDFTVVQIDAHIDWRDEVAGERYGLSSNMRRASEMGHVIGMVQVGQRSIGSARPRDQQDALTWGADLISARTVAREGIAHVLERVPRGANVLFALDIDGMDPAVVPGVIGRAPGGLDYWQVVELIHGVAERAHIAAFNLVEFMPERDVDGLGANVAANVVLNAIAAVVRQG
jgi:agmatinase